MLLIDKLEKRKTTVSVGSSIRGVRCDEIRLSYKDVTSILTLSDVEIRNSFINLVCCLRKEQVSKERTYNNLPFGKMFPTQDNLLTKEPPPITVGKRVGYKNGVYKEIEPTNETTKAPTPNASGLVWTED